MGKKWEWAIVPFLFLLSSAFAQPIVIGAVVSQSGAHAAAADHYGKALELWRDEVNARGGLLRRPVELRVRDDGSDAIKAGELYAKLVAEKAHAFVGPFGSAPALMANAEAEKAARVIVHGAAPATAVGKRSARYVFNAGPRNAAYGEAILELLGERKLRPFLLARDDATAREMAEGARDAAARLGFAPVEIALYKAGTSDFAPLVEKAKAAGADAWVAFGEVRDAADMARTFRRLDYAPRLFYARAAMHPELIKQIGQDAEHTLGALEYHPRLPTPGNREFVAAFRGKWSVAPTAAAAQAYAAASFLAEGIRRANTVEAEKLRETLASLEHAGILPPGPAVAQIQNGRPEVVWPEALRTGGPLEPYPHWGERRYLKK